MGVRYYADYTTLNTNIDVRVDIHDALFSGTSAKLKGTGSGWLNYTHQRLEPSQYTEIQKGEVSTSLHIQTGAHETFRNDIVTSSEGRFEVYLYFDDVLEWKGTVLPDLCSYTESSDEVLTIKAKDFTTLKKDNFTLSTTRETIITTIESILSDFSLPVITATSWTEANTTSTDDFLRQIYHDRTALRQFTDADNTDIQITNEEALRWILRGYGLTLKQSGGALRIDQFSAYEDPTTLLSTYNSGFQSQVETDVTQTATVTIESDNKPNAGLKRVKNTFDHRTQTSLPTIPQSIIVTDTARSFSFSIAPSGQTVRLSCSVGVPTDFEPSGFNSQPEGGVRTRIIIKAGQYYWDGDEWTETFSSLDKNLTTTFIGGQFIGNYSVITSELPADTDATFEITFNPAVTLEDVDWNITQTEYFSIEFELDTEGLSESIQYELVNADSYTLDLTYPTTYFGDGPLLESPSALRYSTTLADLTSNSWQRRGGGTDRSFHSNLLHEILDPRRGARRVLNGVIKSTFTPHKVLSYDSTYFYYLGGSFDGYTGNWNIQAVEISITDNEEAIATLVENRIQSLISGLGNVVDLTTRDLRKLFGVTTAIGVTTVDYDEATTTTLDAELNVPMRSGIEYWVVNETELDWRDLQAGIYSVIPIFVGGERVDYGTGTIDIEEQVINAPAGSLILKAPAQSEIDENTAEELDEEFDTRITDLDTELDVLDGELNTLNTVTLPNLQNELDAAEADIATLNTVTLPNLQSELDVAEADIATLNTTTIPNLQNELDVAEADIATLNTTTIPNLQTELDNLNEVEIVASLPATGNYEGRIVFLTTDDKLYRYTGTAWTKEVAAVDIAGTITETQIADDSISTPKLQANSITAAKIEAATITANEIATNTITADKILAGAVTAAKIDTDAVTANKILAGAITAVKIATDAVTADKIIANAITTAKIAANAITANEIATDAVTANKIIAGAITTAKIAANAITANEIATDAITANKIQAGAIVAGKLSADAVVANNIAADAVTTNKILAGAVTALKIDVDDLAANSAFILELMAQNLTLRTGGLIKSNNFDGTITAGEITSVGTLGFAFDSTGYGVLNNVDVRGTLNADDITAWDATIDGTLTMGAGGEITNSGGDFIIDSGGFSVFGGSIFAEDSSYILFNSTAPTPADPVGYLSSFEVGSTLRVQLEAQQGADLVLVSTTGKVWLNNSQLQVSPSLPTSAAGLSSGDVFTQTATQLGGSGTTKVLCVV